MCAVGTTAPLLSVTVPLISEFCCANAPTEISTRNRGKRSNLCFASFLHFIYSLPSKLAVPFGTSGTCGAVLTATQLFSKTIYNRVRNCIWDREGLSRKFVGEVS